MDFQSQAGSVLSQGICEVCHGEIHPDESVHWDADSAGSGDDQRVVLRVRHDSCHQFVREHERRAASHATIAAYTEAVNVLRFNEKPVALEALTFRAKQACGEFQIGAVDVLRELFKDVKAS